MLSKINCSCGESICNDEGKCVKCGKYRMLSRDLQEKMNNIERQLEDLKKAFIEFLNDKDKSLQ